MPAGLTTEVPVGTPTGPPAATGPAGAAVPAGAHVLVGGVGYTNLRDLSLGPELIARLRRDPWPTGVDVEDLSAGAIHLVHELQSRPRYAAAVLAAAVARGRPAGSIHERRWAHPPVSGDEVQERIGEALTGVISLDALLIVLDHFGVLPDDTTLIEVEPVDHGWGEGFSPTLAAQVPVIEARVRAAVLRAQQAVVR